MDKYMKVLRHHETSLNLFNGYYSPECTCGWSGGCWAARDNATYEIDKHHRAIKEHVIEVKNANDP